MSPESATAKHDPLIGRTICGCKIIRLLAQGGMGNLYEAHQQSLGRTVALKVLAPALAANQQFLRRFRREAQALAGLIHTNIVAVHDFGSDSDVYGIVMEHVPGESVADLLARSDILPIAKGVDIVRQVADGLAFAHRHQIIHCDMKPENILITPDGVAKVVDFGLAKSLGGEAMKVTQDGTILGTPRYMSPEQCAGTDLDHRTDIYSLGATFFRMIAGRDVFEGENPFAIMLKHKSEPPPDPREFNPEIPVPVADILLRMLEKDPEKRFEAADEISAALRQHTVGLMEHEETPHPRRDLDFVRDLLGAGLATVEDVRKCLAVQDELRQVGVEESLAALMSKRGILDKNSLSELQGQRRTRESQEKDRLFQRLVLDSGLVDPKELKRCIEGYRNQRRAGKTINLSTVLVRLGVLSSDEVAELIRKQIKEIQREDDEEFLTLLRRDPSIPEAHVVRCINEQKHLEARKHHKLLRHIAVDLGLIPARVVRNLLHSKVRDEIEEFLHRVETIEELDSTPLVFDEGALKVEEEEPCPACGARVRVGQDTCSACGRNIEEARRKAARRGAIPRQGAPASQEPSPPPPASKPAKGRAKPTRPPSEKKAKRSGRWQLRLRDGNPSKPITFRALIKLAREKRLRPTTILRGPLTRNVWRQARHTPRLCRLFGVCHFCEKSIPLKAHRCPSCGTLLDYPSEE